LKEKKTFLTLDVLSVLSFAKFCNKSRSLDDHSARNLIKVRNLVAHYLVEDFMDDDTFRYCMQEIKLAVEKNNIKVPFIELLEKVMTFKTTGNKPINLDEIAEKLYLEATKTAGSFKDLLRRISRSYGNKTFIQSNGSFDASLEMLQVSCQLLTKHKIEARRLEEEYEDKFEQVWRRHSLLIGNLKNCIDLVIDKTKKTIGESFSKSSQQDHPRIFESNTKVAIMAIKALTEKQLGSTKKLSFKDLKAFCKDAIVGSARNKKDRTKKGNQKRNTNIQKNKESKAAAESNASVSNKNKNTQRLQEILQSLEEKIILANNYIVRSNVHPLIVKSKIYDMAKERFPNHVDYNAISVQHYSSQALVYENLSVNYSIEDTFNKISIKSFESFLTSVEKSIEFHLITCILEGKIRELFDKNVVPFLVNNSIYNYLSQLSGKRKSIEAMLRKPYYQDLMAEAVAHTSEYMCDLYENIKKNEKLNDLDAFSEQKKKKLIISDLQRYLTTQGKTDPYTKCIKKRHLNEDTFMVLLTVDSLCKGTFAGNTAHLELRWFLVSEAEKFYESLMMYKKTTIKDKNAFAYFFHRVLPLLLNYKYGDEVQPNCKDEEERLFVIYFFYILEFEHFKQKAFKYGFGQARTFLAFWSYYLRNTENHIYRDINFQYSHNDVFDLYGTEDNSLLHRWITEKTASEAYYNEIENSRITKNDKVKVNLSADRKKKLEELLNNDLFKFNLSESFAEAVRNCVLNFATNSSGTRLVAAEDEHFEAARNECGNIVFENIKFENEFTSIVKSWLNFFATTSKKFIYDPQGSKLKEYTKNLEVLLRIAAKYAVLKLITRECDSINVKQHVDLIFTTFPYRNKAVNVKDLYKDFCVACYGCFYFWKTNPSFLSKFLSKCNNSKDFEETFTEAILFKKNLSVQDIEAIGAEEQRTIDKFQNEKADKVIADVKTYYEANSRFKHLVEDADSMFSGWYKRRKVTAQQKKEGNPHCLLEKMLGVGENFKKREVLFIQGLLDERIRKYLTNEQFEPIKVAVENHCYDESNETQNKYVNQLCLRRKCLSLYDQVIHGIESSLWPAVNITNENEKKILLSLIFLLDIFNKENTDSAQNALYAISYNVSSDEKIVKLFNDSVRKSFDKLKLKNCLLSLSHLNQYKSDIDELVLKKLQPIESDKYVKEQITNNIKFKKPSKKMKNPPSKAKDEKSKIKNDNTKKTTGSTGNLEKASSNKRKSSGDVGPTESKILKTSDDFSNEKSEKAEKMEVKSSDESLQEKTKNYFQVDECLNEYEFKKHKLINRKANTDFVSKDVDELQRFNNSVKMVEPVLQRVKLNLARIRRYHEKLNGERWDVQRELRHSVLQELCEFYWKHVGNSTAEHEDYDSKLSSLSTKLAGILQLPDFSQQFLNSDCFL